MSPIGQHGGGIVVERFELPPGHRFHRHRHDTHQLAWASHGLVTMRIDDRVWVLPRSRALWIPAGMVHEVLIGRPTTMLGIYVEPRRCPVRWHEPTVVDTSGLLGELLDHLCGELAPPARRRAEAVVFDLLRPLPVATLTVPIPTDPRARAVADDLLAEPADARSLAAWGRT